MQVVKLDLGGLLRRRLLRNGTALRKGGFNESGNHAENTTTGRMCPFLCIKPLGKKPTQRPRRSIPTELNRLGTKDLMLNLQVKELGF